MPRKEQGLPAIESRDGEPRIGASLEYLVPGDQVDVDKLLCVDRRRPEFLCSGALLLDHRRARLQAVVERSKS